MCVTKTASQFARHSAIHMCKYVPMPKCNIPQLAKSKILYKKVPFSSQMTPTTRLWRAISPVVVFPVSDWLKSAREFPVFVLVDIGQPTGWLEDLGGRCPMCRGSLTQDLVGPLVSDTRQEGEDEAPPHVANFF